MKLVVGFITYNNSSSPYLNYFLNSLKKAIDFSGISDYLIISFDNSSLDFKDNHYLIKDFLKQNPDTPFDEIRSNENIGFARAYNIMIAKAISLKAEYFLIINPDTLLELDSIKLLVEALKADESLAAASPRLMSWDFLNLKKTELIDSLGIGLKAGLKFFDICQSQTFSIESSSLNNFLSESRKIIAPSGAAGLFRLKYLVKIAEIRDNKKEYFDERFFMYKEDCDLAYRLFLANMKSICVDSAVIYHDRSVKSFGSGLKKLLKSRNNKSRQAKSWSFTNQHFIFIKYFKYQNFLNKVIILFKTLAFFIFSLILEQYLLKNYKQIYIFLRNERKFN